MHYCLLSFISRICRKFIYISVAGIFLLVVILQVGSQPQLGCIIVIGWKEVQSYEELHTQKHSLEAAEAQLKVFGLYNRNN